jgi:tetratricopeptide (TPR) repeat protein
MGRKSRHKHAATPQALHAPKPVARRFDPRMLTLAVCAVLAVAILSIYAQVASHSFLNYDDNLYITENAHVKAGLAADSIRWSLTAFHPNWHPLTWLTYLVDVSLFGVKPAPMLFANVLLHIASTLLLFLFLRRTTGCFSRSAVAAAIFGLHPLRVESVAWVAERKDVLSGLFFFLTLLLYARWTESRSRRLYVAALATFAIGLTAKGMLVTLPFVLLLIDYWPLNRYDLKRGIVEKIPFFVILIPGLALTFLTQKKIEAIAATELVSPAARIANAVLSYLAYIGKIFWPSHLAIPYPLRIVLSRSDVAVGAVILIAITIVAWLFRARRYLLTGWLWYLGMLVPVSGLVQIGSQSMADRYTYLPSVGLTFAVVWLVADLVRSRAALIAAAAVTLIALGVVAFIQVGYWKNSETLFRHSLAVTEKNRIAHTYYGLALLETRAYDEAAAEFRAALELNPGDDLAHNGLGTALAASGKTTQSEAELRAAIARRPNDIDAYRSLGRLLLSSGRKDEAVPILEKAIALRPDPGTRAELAVARGNTEAAIIIYRDAVKATPGVPEAHNDLAAMLARAGKEQEALAEYNEALRLDPHQYDVRMNLGALLSRMNDDAGAAAHFEAAARERPKSPEPHVYLALILTKGGRNADAATHVRSAIAADHDAANAQLTTALGMPPNPANIDNYLAYLQQQQRR